MRFAALALLILTLCGCFREGFFSFVRSPPDESLLPGDYRLAEAAYSHASLQQNGYSDLSATVMIRADGTFSIMRIPDCCVYGEFGFFGGYFDASGTWKVKRSSSVYEVEFHFERIHREGRADIKQPQLFSAVSFHLTKGKRRYGLAAPLFDGDFQYAYFEKKG